MLSLLTFRPPLALLVPQLNNEPGAEDGDAGAEKRAEGDQDEDAGLL